MFTKIVAVVIGIISIVLIFVEPIAGIIFLAFAIFIWFAGKNMQGQVKGAKSRESFEFPQTDSHGHKLLTVYDMNVTGVMREHDGIDPQTIIPKLFEGDQLLLEADPTNPYDPNAVKVKTTTGIQIGWLPQGENLQIDIANRLNSGQVVYARVKKGYLLNNYPGKVGLVIDVARYSKSRGKSVQSDTYYEDLYSETTDEPIYDEITDEIYKCFIDYTGDPIPETMYNIIEKVCSEHGGRCYKSPAKSANFVIISSKFHRHSERIEFWHKKGYKVTTIERATEYWDLT